MTVTLPQRIRDYKVRRTSPTEELRTLGQLLSEVGDYASTQGGKGNLALTRLCDTRLAKITAELTRRKEIRDLDDLLEPKTPGATTHEALRLEDKSIDDLHTLYRQGPEREKARIAAGREPLTFWYERRIVEELKQRETATTSEQLKIDHCLMSYSNELANLSGILKRPVNAGGEKIRPDHTRDYAPAELTALIRRYTRFKDVEERELLVEYTDMALDRLETATEHQPLLGLAAEIAELGRKKIIKVPKEVRDILAATLAEWRRAPQVDETEVVIPMLTLAMLDGDSRLERKATTIINRCYRACTAKETANPEDACLADRKADGTTEDTSTVKASAISRRIAQLHIAATCSDYITRLSIRRLATAWNETARTLLSHAAPSTETSTNTATGAAPLTETDTVRLLEAAAEIAPYALLDKQLRTRLSPTKTLKISKYSQLP